MLAKLKTLLSDSLRDTLTSVGLLLLRLGAGGFMITHGVPKLQKWEQISTKFHDPIGLGSPVALALAISAEIGAAALLALGAGTRLVAIPLIITMLVAAFDVHWADPFKKKELALMYLTCYVTLLLTGPGKFSVDHAVLSTVGDDA